jgi:glycosyltransferase involved in cell wall biosynthesis
MTRLVVDARMLTYSGIGTYLQNVMPLVLERLHALDPLVLILPRDAAVADRGLPGGAQHRLWDAAPLTAQDFGRPPRDLDQALWWVPHYNVPLRSPAPLVVTLHDLLPLQLGYRMQELGKRFALRSWLHAIRRRARRVLCASEATRRDAVARAGLDPERLRVVHLGAGPAWQRAEAPRADGDAPYIVYVGLLKPHKNAAALLRAFASIADRIPHRLVLIGKHRGVRDVDAAALELAQRMAPRVELHDSVAQPDLIRIVAGAQLLVQPSLHEGFGLPPLEAMACGVPVVAARIAALEEVGGDAAFYCDPHSVPDIGAAMLRVLGDPALRATMRERGRTRASALTWDACASATADVIAEAIAQPSTATAR